MINPESLQNIRLHFDGPILTIYLHRPAVHNAFNREMLGELESVFQWLEGETTVRVVIVTGDGPSFSAGADLNWMREMVEYDFDENLQSARLISSLFDLIYRHSLPVISAINGAVIGGGMGFVGASDIVIATENAVFGFTEVRLGIVPACISTFLLRRVGEGVLKELFLTGRRFSADEAFRKNLINEVVTPDHLLIRAGDIASLLVQCGPNAIAQCKTLFSRIPEIPLDQANEYTAETLAELRISEEALEGMSAFLEKRSPSWILPESEG